MVQKDSINNIFTALQLTLNPEPPSLVSLLNSTVTFGPTMLNDPGAVVPQNGPAIDKKGFAARKQNRVAD